MDDLKSCINLGNLLVHLTEEVEDDTCLDRILTGVKDYLLHGTKRTIPEVEKLFADMLSLMTQLASGHTVSAHRYVIQLASLLLSTKPESSSFQETVSLILSYPDRHMKNRPCVEYYSLAASWLDSMKNLVASWDVIVDMLDTENALQQIVSMASSRSSFVCRQSVECLALIFLKAQEVTSDRTIMQGNSLLNSNCLSMHSLLQLGHALLEFSHTNGIHVLVSQQLHSYLFPYRHELTELCHQCDPVLCHFFESLYCGKNCVSSEYHAQKVITPQETLRCAATCISHQPTKAVGWKILVAFMVYGKPSQERDVAESLIVNTLEFWEQTSQPIHDNGLFEDVQKCLNVLKSYKYSKPAASRVLCHILNAARDLEYGNSMPLSLAICRLVRIITTSMNSDIDISKTTVCMFMENSNALIALLSCLLRNIRLFTTDEKDCVAKLILALISKPSIHHAAIKSCHKIAECLLQSHRGYFLENCVHVTLKGFTDRRWEVRDSALEFLSTLFSKNPSDFRTDLMKLYSECGVCAECIKLCTDSNAFVRAGALKLLGNFASNMQYYSDHRSILDFALNTILQDADASPRRKAVETLVRYLKSNKEFLVALYKLEISDILLDTASSEICEKTRTAIHSGLFHDLDWEVKYNSLDVLSLLLEEDISENQSPSSKLVSMLDTMQQDHDDAVKEKACAIGAAFGITSLSRNSDLGNKSELQSLLMTLLTSLQQSRDNKDVKNDGVSWSEDNEVILDCY